MGTLVSAGGDREIPLRCHHLVGRSQACHLRLNDPEISAVHAALRWTDRGWELGDLGSRNGTRVDGHPVGSGQWVPLVEGSEIAFGAAGARWVLRSGAAPTARAFPDDGGPAQEEQGGLLSLPSPEEPAALIYRDNDGSWVVEGALGELTPYGGEPILVAGRSWQLELPDLDPRTPLVQNAGLAGATLRFFVSADEEYVELRVVTRGVEHDLGARAHHYLLLTLARLRLKDREASGKGASEHGWVSLDRLSRMLRLEERPMNLQIFRIRRQFSELGLGDAADVVERRRGTGQLRVGLANLVISPLGGDTTAG